MAAAKYAQSAILLGALALTVVLYSPRLVAQGGVGITVNEEDSRQILTLQHSTALMTAAAEVPEHIIIVGASAADPGMLETDESQIAILQNDAPIIGVADAGETLFLDGSALAGRPSTLAKERIVVNGADDVETHSLGALVGSLPLVPTVLPTLTSSPSSPTDPDPVLTTIPPSSTDAPQASVDVSSSPTEAGTADTSIPPTLTKSLPTSTIAILRPTEIQSLNTTEPVLPVELQDGTLAAQDRPQDQQKNTGLFDGVPAAIITAIASIVAAIITAIATVAAAVIAYQAYKRHKDNVD